MPIMLPFPVKPMFLHASKEAFDSADHIFEWKVDGIRSIMFYYNGKVRLQSETGKDCTTAFPELWVPSNIPHDSWIYTMYGGGQIPVPGPKN